MTENTWVRQSLDENASFHRRSYAFFAFCISLLNVVDILDFFNALSHKVLPIKGKFLCVFALF